MERIKIEFSKNDKLANQEVMNSIEQHCQQNLMFIEMIGFTKWITLKTPMPNVRYLIIQKSDFGANGHRLCEWFSNIRYLKFQSISGTATDRGKLLKQSFKHLENLWLDCSNVTNRNIRTFLGMHPELMKLHLEFNEKGTSMTKNLLIGIHSVLKKLKTLTIIPTIPVHPAQGIAFKPPLFNELEELNVHGYFDSQFDMLSYLSISDENLKHMTIEVRYLNEITCRSIGFYACLQSLTISAINGLNFTNLTNIVDHLLTLRKIQIIKVKNDNDLRNVDEFLEFIARFDRLEEIVLIDSSLFDYLYKIQEQLANTNWNIQSKQDAIRIFKL